MDGMSFGRLPVLVIAAVWLKVVSLVVWVWWGVGGC